MDAYFWKDKLAPLVERDMFIREGLLQRGVLHDGYHKEMEKVHIENARKLKALIDAHGFPVLSSAGESAVKLAWSTAQRSPYETTRSSTITPDTLLTLRN